MGTWKKSIIEKRINTFTVSDKKFAFLQEQIVSPVLFLSFGSVPTLPIYRRKVAIATAINPTQERYGYSTVVPICCTAGLGLIPGSDTHTEIPLLSNSSEILEWASMIVILNRKKYK